MRPHFDFEKQKGGVCVGVDEAGCGPWAGPVVATAAFLDFGVDERLLTDIHDSKKLSEAKRKKIFEALLTLPPTQFVYAVGAASVHEIDHLNIREATKLAMKRAVEALSFTYDYILVDGNRMPVFTKPAHMIIKGDQQSYSIAAASIVAKVVRDSIMHQLDQQFPHYLWQKNAGYGTQDHQRAIAQWGITCHHRQSFAPIRNYMKQNNIDVVSSRETFYSHKNITSFA